MTTLPANCFSPICFANDATNDICTRWDDCDRSCLAFPCTHIHICDTHYPLIRRIAHFILCACGWHTTRYLSIRNERVKEAGRLQVKKNTTCDKKQKELDAVNAFNKINSIYHLRDLKFPWTTKFMLFVCVCLCVSVFDDWVATKVQREYHWAWWWCIEQAWQSTVCQREEKDEAAECVFLR